MKSSKALLIICFLIRLGVSVGKKSSEIATQRKNDFFAQPILSSRRTSPPSIEKVETMSSSARHRKSTEVRGGDTTTMTTSAPVELPDPPAAKMSTFTKIRRTIFPIYGRQEVTKFLLLGSMKFFIIMALTLTRDTKDTLVVTESGAEAIAFLKVSKEKRFGFHKFQVTGVRRI